jgi:hypothetical protein
VGPRVVLEAVERGKIPNPYIHFVCFRFRKLTFLIFVRYPEKLPAMNRLFYLLEISE